MNAPSPERLSARDQAAAFFARSRSGTLTEVDRTALEAWLAADDANARAYEEVASLWSGLEAIRANPSMLALRDEARRMINRKRGLRVAAAFAALTLLAGAGLWLRGAVLADRQAQAIAERSTDFQTAIGQLSTVVLPDGSSAVLDTDTAIRVSDRTDRRSVELLRGRALFKVRHDPARPFVVAAAGRSVTALGTEFDVYLRQDAVEVGLITGRVRVEQQLETAQRRVAKTVDLSAGHRLTASNRGWTLSSFDPGSEPGWLERQLVFQEATLSDIVAELNRYSSRKIVLIGPEVASSRMSAVLRSDDPSTFLASVEALHLGRVAQSNGSYLISSP